MEDSDKIIKAADLAEEPDERGVGYVLYKKMLENGEKIAQVDVVTEERDTYASLCERCLKIASFLQRKVRPGDVVSLCTINTINACVPLLACYMSGAILAPLDPKLPISDAIFLLRYVQPKIIFVIPESLQLIEDCLNEGGIETEIVVFGPHNNYINFFDILEETIESFQCHEAENFDEIALIIFSSGTTGLPKGICLNHYTILGQINNFIEGGWSHLCNLGYASYYWISGNILLLSTILTGSRLVVCPSFNPKEMWTILDKFQVSLALIAPIHAISFQSVGRPDGIDTTHFKELLIIGGAVSSYHFKEIQDVLPGTHVFRGYGQTEVSGFLTAYRPKFVKDVLLSYKKPESVGKPVLGMTYKVVDCDTEEPLGPLQHGELRIKTRLATKQYYNLDSSNITDADGFLKTGDIVYYDADLCFFVVDRIKEMLKFRSWHIAPNYLENILMGHKDVGEVVVVGIPHEQDGDHPVAIIVLKDADVVVTAEEIEKYVEDRVDDRQRLRGGVRFAKELPLTPSKKYKRKEIREMVLRGEI